MNTDNNNSNSNNNKNNGPNYYIGPTPRQLKMRRLWNAVAQTVPADLDIRDAYTVFKIVVEGGLVDLDVYQEWHPIVSLGLFHAFEFKRSDHFQWDAQGKITRLSLNTLLSRFTDHFILGPDILYLERLTSLKVCNCAGIPRDLSMLKDLTSLSMIWSLDPATSETSLQPVTSPTLTELKMFPYAGTEDPGFFLSWIAKSKFPSLRALGLYSLDLPNSCYGQVEAMLSAIHRSKEHKSLGLTEISLSKLPLQKLMFETLPQYAPNLEKLRVQGFHDSNGAAFFDRLQKCWKMGTLSTQFLAWSSNLSTLHFGGLFEWRFRLGVHLLKSDEAAQAALVLLKIFKRVSLIVDDLMLRKTKLNRQIEYYLRINHGGRVLVEDPEKDDLSRVLHGPTSKDDAATNKESETIRPRLPLSIWPRVLERSYRTRPNMFYEPKTNGGHEHECTATYYLLRNGPALAYRIDFSGGSNLPPDGRGEGAGAFETNDIAFDISNDAKRRADSDPQAQPNKEKRARLE